MKTDRRTFLTLGAGAFLVATLPRVRGAQPTLVRRTVPVMGTIAAFAVAHPSRRTAHAAIDAAVAELEWVDETMSRFRADSDVGRLNAAAGAIDVTPPTAFVLAEARRWAEGTGGAFDPCIGRAAALWKGRAAAPPDPLVLRYAGRALYRRLDARGESAERLDPDVAVDLGGIAKGFAVDRAVAALRARGVANALVNAGGDLYALGVSANGDDWRIGVRDPADPAGIVATLAVRDRAVATSGDYVQRHHLLDPRTGAPHRGTRRSLTVSAATCIAADAAATALFGMGGADARAALARLDATARMET